MSIRSCRGEQAKLRIVDQYELSPVAHLKLLAGQETQGCCGRVTNRYYSFEAKERKTSKIEELVVGYDCTEQFLNLIELEPLPLFNPFQSFSRRCGRE